MEYRITEDTSWTNKKKSHSKTYNGIRLYEYDKSLIKNISKTIANKRNFSYIFKFSITDHINEGTIVIISNNSSKNCEFKDTYLGIVENIENSEVKINIVSSFTDFYNPESNTIEYTLEENLKAKIDCSNDNPDLYIIKDKYKTQILSFQIGVLRDDLLSECLGCESKYMISLI